MSLVPLAPRVRTQMALAQPRPQALHAMSLRHHDERLNRASARRSKVRMHRVPLRARRPKLAHAPPRCYRDIRPRIDRDAAAGPRRSALNTQRSHSRQHRRPRWRSCSPSAAEVTHLEPPPAKSLHSHPARARGTCGRSARGHSARYTPHRPGAAIGASHTDRLDWSCARRSWS